MIFLKRHVRLSMSFVLVALVMTNRFGEAAGGELLAEDVAPYFDGLLSVTSGLVERHADRGELRPTSAIRQVGGRFADAGHPRVVSAMSAFVILVTTDVDLELLKAMKDHAIEECLHAVVQHGLISLHVQTVVGLLGDDVASDLFLTTRRVDRHQTTGKSQYSRQLRAR